MVIRGVGQAAPAAGPGRAGPTAAGFAVPAGAKEAAAPAPTAAASLESLLLLQEHQDPTTRDRRARQHGRALLDALARLQLGLLGGDGDGTTLAALAALLDHCPEASDPALRDALAAVSLRAQIEVARRGVSAAQHR